MDAPVFQIVGIINAVILILSLVVQGVAFVHCLTQRGEAFPAINTLPKVAWLSILGIALLLTMLSGAATGIFGLIGVAAAAIYLLDIRTGLRDLTDGKGFW